VVQCDLCGQHFLTRNHLVEHLRAHVSPANRFNIVRHWFDRSVLRYQTVFVGEIESKESILQAMNFVYEDLRELLLLHVSWFRTLKVSMAASCVMVHDDWQPQGNAQVPAYVNKYFVSWCPYPTQVLLGIDDVDMFLNAGMHFMQELLERTTVDRSNVSLCHVRSLHVDLFRIRLIAGHCSNNVACIETLKDLSKPPPPTMREAEPQSDCFLNAVASMFVDEEDQNNVSALRAMARRRFNYNPQDMPMTLQQLGAFEEKQDFPIAINVYSIEKTVKKMRDDGGESNSRVTNYSLSILHRSGNIAPGVSICNLLLLRVSTEQIRVAQTGRMRAGSVKLHFVRMASLSKCVRPVYRGSKPTTWISRPHVHFCSNCQCRLHPLPDECRGMTTEALKRHMDARIEQHERVCFQNQAQKLVMPSLAAKHQTSARRQREAQLVNIDAPDYVDDDDDEEEEEEEEEEDEDEDEDEGDQEEEEGVNLRTTTAATRAAAPFLVSARTFDSAGFVFYNVHRRASAEIVLFYDFESLIEPMENDVFEDDRKHSRLVRYGRHVPFMYSLVVCTIQQEVLYHKTYTGLDAPKDFVSTLLTLEPQLEAFTNRFPDPPNISEDERDRLYRDQQGQCWLCREPLDDDDDITQPTVLDHSHCLKDPETGQPLIMGLCHRDCNLQRRRQVLFPAVAHNAQRYDCTLWLPQCDVQELKAQGYRVRLSGAAASGENFKILKLNHFDFVDSLNFLKGSLDSIVETARQSGCRFEILKALPKFANVPDELLFAKAAFPYELCTSMEVMREHTAFPERAAFYSKLRENTVCQEDYDAAKRLYTLAGCANLLEFCQLYVQLDVGLLASSFLMFRDEMYQWCGLDVSKCISLPSMTLDIFLDRHKPDIELLTDHTMYLTFAQALRGGLSQAVTRYTRAGTEVNLVHHEQLERQSAAARTVAGDEDKGAAALTTQLTRPLKMDPVTAQDPVLQHAFPIVVQPSEEGQRQLAAEESQLRARYKDIYEAKTLYRVLSCLDLNGLYAHAMSSYLPSEDFHWIPDAQLESFSADAILALPADGERGYTFTVDLEYDLAKAHSDPLHNMLPLFIHQQDLSWDDLSPYSQAAFVKQMSNNVAKAMRYTSRKLVASFRRQENYTVHFRLLQFLLRHDVKLVRVRSIIGYKQRPFIRPYVQECVTKRVEAKTALQSQCFKLCLNSLYGKLVMHCMCARARSRLLTFMYFMSVFFSHAYRWRAERITRTRDLCRPSGSV
jgi:hypothetical protein